MQHWHKVLPRDRILTVRYESLVGDFEAEARRMLAFLDLKWDRSVLRFHEAPRAVATASIAQVRKPVGQGRVGRWRRYARHLAPLLTALGREDELVEAIEEAKEVEAAASARREEL